jgi:putative restriction endonuclease
MLTITPDYHMAVSPRIREEWFNGKAYYRLHGQPLTNLPTDARSRPHPAYLQWHNENRYVA